jgi:hypothetical protein
MSSSGVKVGIVLGMVTAIAGFFPLFQLIFGDCFWEQGCEPHENVRVLGVILGSCFAGLVAGWLTAHFYTLLVSRLSRN